MAMLSLRTAALLGSVALSACGSGEMSAPSSPKIVGGTNVSESQNDARRLATVALTTDTVMREGQKPPLGEHHSFCTGTLIAPRVVVTAAHCIQAFDAQSRQKLPRNVLPKDSDFIAYMGTVVDSSGNWVRAAKAIPHPDWSPEQTLSPRPSTAPNDIGLLILAEDAVNGAEPVEIADPSDSLTANLELAGFGITQSRDNNDTGTLRQVTVPVSTADETAKRITLGGFTSFGRGACAGDSGGPAYMEKDGKLVLVGATSTGAELFGRCVGIMSNYTDVRYYKDWINSTVEKELGNG